MDFIFKGSPRTEDIFLCLNTWGCRTTVTINYRMYIGVSLIIRKHSATLNTNKKIKCKENMEADQQGLKIDTNLY